MKPKKTCAASAASLADAAPCALDSYMAVLVASRHNPILAACYRRLRKAGKPPKLALTATMRKLLLVLNSTLKIDPLPA